MHFPEIFKLSNGIRAVHQRREGTDIIHCALFLNVGSRDETSDNQGIAHFWEHMAFKGTRRRKSYQILSWLDSVGGELNAYTDKEKVVFFASVRKEYFERAVDILSDIAFNSVFPSNQIEKERGVILEEMAMYNDNPDDSLQDEFEAVVYRKHPMGMNILGRPETVQSFRRTDFIRFCREHIDTTQVVFSSVGDIRIDQVQRACTKYLEVRALRSKNGRVKFSRYRSHHVELRRPMKQAKCAIGRESYSTHHENRIPFYMLVNLLGGPGMNSRLNMALRERHGYVYTVEAAYSSYSDTGLFSVMFGTEPKQLERCLKIIRREFDRLIDKPLGDRQLRSAKEQIKGQMALAEESGMNFMLMMGRSMLDLGRVPTQHEIFEKVQQVDAIRLRDVAEEMLGEKGLSVLRMIPSGKIVMN